MKNNNRFFKNFKQWSLKVSVSSIIFISVVMLGGAIITLALPSSLDEVKSPNAHYSLTAENWDYTVDQIKSGAVTLTNLSGELTTLSGRVNTLSGAVSSNTTNISNLSGKLSTLSGTISILLGNGVRTKNGDSIYYTNGNVGIGTTPSSAYKLYVSGSGYFSKPLYAPTPTSSSSSTQVATKEYVDSKSTTSQPQYMYIGLNSTNAHGASETYSVSDVDFCIINSVTYSTKDGYCSQCNEYCYAYPTTELNWALPNGVEVYSWKTLGRTTRKLFVGGDDDDQIDCGFICVRL